MVIYVCGFWFPFLALGALCLVLFLFLLLVVLALLPVCLSAAGCGRVVRYLPVLVGRLLLRVCSCRLVLRPRLMRSLLPLLGLVGVRGFALVLPVRLCLRRVGFLLLGGASRWRCLLVGLRVLPVLCCLAFAVGSVAVVGSRSLPLAFAPLVGRVVQLLVASGRSVSVGCCVGADAFALSAGVPVSALQIFCAFGAGGVGACRISAVPAVLSFAASGGCVSWWSGGNSSVALPVRLSVRTSAVVASASVSCVVFFSSPLSSGTVLACRAAVARGLPVFAFACGLCGSALPILGAGSWVVVGGSGVFASAFRWVSSQASLVQFFC